MNSDTVRNNKMPHPQLDRSRLRFRPLAQRRNLVTLEEVRVDPDAPAPRLPDPVAEVVAETAARMRQARRERRIGMLAFGAHTIKNGLGPVLIRLMEEGWLQHLATNGAGVIHDWEFAYQGMTSEDVRANLASGQFGLWEETGKYINLAIAAGAYRGMGYGESVGTLVMHDGLDLPAAADLEDEARRDLGRDPERCAAALDFCALIRQARLPAGFLELPHPHKSFCVQAEALRLGLPFTAHPMIGHDIIYSHPLNRSAAIGRAAERDFLVFAHNIARLDGGVYLSVGSAVMSPMIFEKSLAMARNLNRTVEPFIVVVDLAPAAWDWQTRGEPPKDHPAYYLRTCKTFSRAGGEMRYVTADSRDFLLSLYHALKP